MPKDKKKSKSYTPSEQAKKREEFFAKLPDAQPPVFSPPTEEEAERINELFKTGKDPGDDIEVYKEEPSIVKGNIKKVLVVPHLEKANIVARQLQTIILLVMLFLVGTVCGLYIFEKASGMDAGDIIKSITSDEPYIAEGGYMVFGEFEGYVTLGDKTDRIVEILGIPDEVYDSKYYYGESYLIIENDTVTGFYIHKDDDFKVTIGEAEFESGKAIFEDDTAERVVSILGTPRFCEKTYWIYDDIIINFDDEYKVSYYEKIK